MKKAIIFFPCILFLQNIQAQLIKEWDYRYGGSSDDVFGKIVQTNDNGFLLTGMSYSDSSGDKSQNNWGTSTDFWIVKTDSSGIKQWDKRFGGLSGEAVVDAVQCKDGGYLLGGWSESGIGGNKTQNSRGGRDYWIVKTDGQGDYQWDKRFGGFDDDVLWSMQQTKDGGYILAGGSYSGSGGDKTQNSQGDMDYWIVKVDSIGSYQWDKRFGGIGLDGCNGVYQTKDGGYILAGGSESDISGDRTESNWGLGGDYWIVRIDSIGTKIWDKRYGGNKNESLWCMDVTTSGKIILGGTSISASSGDKTEDNWGNVPDGDFWIVLIDSIGNKILDKHFGGVGYEELSSVKATRDHGFLAAGYSWSNISGDKSEHNAGNTNAWAIKFDSTANKQWDKTLLNYSYNMRGYAIEANDGGLVIGTISSAAMGGDKSQDSQGGDDYFFAKFFRPAPGFIADTSVCEKFCVGFTDLSNNNPVSWMWLFPGGSPPGDTAQNPLVCYNNPGVFDVTLITFNGIEYDTLTLTDYITVYPTPSTPVITVTGDTLTSTSAMTYQWYFNQQSIPGATNQSYVATQFGEYSVEITDENSCPTFSESFELTGIDIVNGNDFQILPNPASEFFSISFSSPDFSPAQIKILDVLGRNLFSDEIKSNQLLQIATEKFSGNNILFCELWQEVKLISVQKILIQQ